MQQFQLPQRKNKTTYLIKSTADSWKCLQEEAYQRCWSSDSASMLPSGWFAIIMKGLLTFPRRSDIQIEWIGSELYISLIRSKTNCKKPSRVSWKQLAFFPQIKHGCCFLSPCKHLHASINLFDSSSRQGGCYRFCVTRWALEYRLIGYAWIIHLKHSICCLAMWSMSMAVGGADGAKRTDAFSAGRVKMIRTLSANFSSSAQTAPRLFLPV